MLLHPDLMLAQIHDRQRELIAEADRHRLLAAARRNRARQAGADRAAARQANARPLRVHEGHATTAGAAEPQPGPAARGRPDDTLAPCGSSVAAPAR